MNLLNRLSVAVRAAAHDLLRAPEPPRDTVARSTALLKSAQGRMDGLNEQLAQSVAREKRSEQAWRDAAARASALETEVDAAVRASEDELAHSRLAQLKAAQNKVQQLSDSWRADASSSEKLRLEIQTLQAQLAAVQRRLDQADERKHNAVSLETPQQAGREQRSEMAQSHDALKAPEEQAAQGEDRTPARKELDQTRVADLLKKRDP